MIKSLIFLIILGCSTSRNIKKSDHYDPIKDRFYNQYTNKTKGFWEVIKWKWSTNPAQWPDWVDLEHEPDLSAVTERDEVKVSFIGHSSFLLQFKELNILTDPVWSYRVSPVSWAGPARHHKPGIDLERLPKIDVIIISHNHYDHMDLETLKSLEKAHSPLIIAPKGDKDLLTSQGLKNVVELDWWEKTPAKNFQFTYLPAQHFSGRGLFDRFESLWGSFAISTSTGKNVFFGGDTGYSKHFLDIQSRIPHMDLAFIPIGAYAPRWFMKPMHMNPEEAVKAHFDLKAKQSIGIHFGTFQLTDEAIDEPVKELEIHKKKQGLTDKNFTSLSPGESRIFNL